MRTGRQAEKTIRMRARLIESTVQVIRQQGLQSASPLRIARQSGASWGAVQHHFGAKEDLLLAIIRLCRAEFIEAVTGGEYAGASLADRVSRFVERVAAIYHSDVFLAAVEIAFWHRNNAIGFNADLASEDDALVSAALMQVFDGAGVSIERASEAAFHLHCVLTGLAYQEILSGGNVSFDRHLAHVERTMIAIISGNDD